MHCRIFLVSFVLSCAAAAGLAQQAPPFNCADLKLVPAVRECGGNDSLLLNAGANVVADNNPEDQFAAEDLKAALDSAGVSAPARDAITISLARADSEAGKRALDQHNLKFDAAMHDEGYMLAGEGKDGVAVVAETSAGLFYGVQTLKQLIHGWGKDAVLLVPTIRDWPAMAHRGISDDWSRGPLPNMEFLKREIRTLAAYKLNLFSPYFENTFAYASSPVAAFPGGAMTPDQARELVAYAGKYHITIIPEQESFGHLHSVLKFQQFAGLAETPNGAVLAPGDPRTLPLIGEWFAELAKVFPGPWVHIGADETFELGLGRTREEVQQKGLGAVYLDFLSRIHQTLAPNHKQLLFWGDIAEHSPDLVSTLPKDMIAVPWEYDAKPDFTGLILPFKNAGLETWVAPGVNNWSRLYPNNNEALGNIRAFVRDGQKLGSTGMLNTIWNDDGEGIFDENWFGVLFGAAASWQPGESSQEVFTASYGQAFHRDVTGKISQAQRELMAAHNDFKAAGLGDAGDDYFWLDPFSPEGQAVAGKIRPQLASLRLHAERAIALIAEARAAAKLENQPALDAMDLGARRIDFVGLKFQFADECVVLYRHALSLTDDPARWDELAGVLWTISSSDGRFEDIRNGYALLGQLYREAWLRDNRPYWLANNMARYHAATELWEARAARWQQVREQWDETHTLPTPQQAGLPAWMGN